MPFVLVPSKGRPGARPYATIAVAAVCLLAYLVETLLGGSERGEVLHRMGAVEHDLVWGHEHQLYRLLCPAFLHMGIFHIAANGYALVQLGPFIERIWGSWRFVIVYLLSAIGGCVASSLAPHTVSVGASGAIFGLLGYLVAAGWRGDQRHQLRTIVESHFGQSLVLWAGVNVWFGFTQSHIDNNGHLGGLATGLAIGTILTDAGPTPGHVRAVAGVLVLATFASFAACFAQDRRGAGGGARGSDADEDPFSSALERAIQAADAGQLEAAVSLCELAVRKAPQDPRVMIAYTLEAETLLRLKRYDDAKLVLEVSFQTRPSEHDAAQLSSIALLTSDAGGAVDWAERAARASPSHAEIRQLAHVARELAEKGHPVEALDAIGRARRISPGVTRSDGVDLGALEQGLREKTSPR